MIAAPAIRRTRAVLWVLALAVALLAILSEPAHAHAAVEATFPADGSILEEAPVEVSITFNEGVGVPTAGLRVYDSTGERIDLGDSGVDPQNTDRARVSVPGDAREGTYVVTWRATSADGHPVKGAFVYSVIADEGVGDDLVGALFAGGEDTVVVVTSVAVRGVTMLSVLMVAGLIGFGLLVDPGISAATDALVRRLAWVGLAASLVGLPVQSMLATGFGPLDAVGATPMLDLLGQPVGWSGLVRAALLAGVVVGQRRGLGSLLVAGFGVAALLSFALDGHSLTQQPIAVMFVADVAHLLAGATWLGGLVGLGMAVRARRRADDPIDAAAVVARFSGVATWALGAVSVAGSAMAWVTVRQPRALTTTDYGRTLLAKVAIVAVVALVGLYNNRRLVPAVAGGVGEEPDARPARVADVAWARLGGTLRAEAGLLAVVVLITGLLVGLQPAAQEAGITGAFSTCAPLGDDLEVNLVIDPNRAGLNELHVYVLTPTGRVAEQVEGLRLELEQRDHAIGPIEREPLVAGPGHWTLTGRDFSIPGRWAVTIRARTGRFDEQTTTIEVVVN